jgi:hypothetical protein
MRRQIDTEDYELREEYDFSKMTIVPKGRYAPDRRVGKNVAVLDSDICEAFPTDQSVNEALRLVMRLSQLPKSLERKSVQP